MHTHNTENRTQNTTYMQHIHINTAQDTEQNTEQDTENTLAQPQHRCSAHNYRTYSLDYYHEYAYIKNSNTIEIYTILQDKI